MIREFRELVQAFLLGKAWAGATPSEPPLHPDPGPWNLVWELVRSEAGQLVARGGVDPRVLVLAEVEHLEACGVGPPGGPLSTGLAWYEVKAHLRVTDQDVDRALHAPLPAGLTARLRRVRMRLAADLGEVLIVPRQVAAGTAARFVADPVRLPGHPGWTVEVEIEPTPGGTLVIARAKGSGTPPSMLVRLDGDDWRPVGPEGTWWLEVRPLIQAPEVRVRVLGGPERVTGSVCGLCTCGPIPLRAMAVLGPRGNRVDWLPGPRLEVGPALTSALDGLGTQWLPTGQEVASWCLAAGGTESPAGRSGELAVLTAIAVAHRGLALPLDLAASGRLDLDDREGVATVRVRPVSGWEQKLAHLGPAPAGVGWVLASSEQAAEVASLLAKVRPGWRVVPVETAEDVQQAIECASFGPPFLAWKPAGWPELAPAAARAVHRAWRLARRRVGVDHLLSALRRDARRSPPLTWLRTTLAERGEPSPWDNVPASPNDPGTPRLQALGAVLPAGATVDDLAVALRHHGGAILEQLTPHRHPVRSINTEEATRTLGTPRNAAKDLQVVGGPDDGRRLALHPGQTVGRHVAQPKADVLLGGVEGRDNAVSRLHLTWLGPGKVRAEHRVHLRRGAAAWSPLEPGDAAEVSAGDLMVLTDHTWLVGVE